MCWRFELPSRDASSDCEVPRSARNDVAWNTSSFTESTAWWRCFEKHCPTTIGSIRHSRTSFSPRGREDGGHSHENLWHRTSQPCGRCGTRGVGAGAADLAVLWSPEESFSLDHARVAQSRLRRSSSPKSISEQTGGNHSTDGSQRHHAGRSDFLRRRN